MKFRTGLMLGAAAMTGLALTFHPGYHNGAGFLSTPAQAESTTPDASPTTNHAETYRLLTLFGTVLDLVRADYVEPVSDRDLITNALNGMLSGLDPHSSYMTQKQYDDMMVQMKGEFGGLGLELQQQDGHIRVVSPIDGTPGFRAGIKPGDYIIAVDGHTIDGTPLDEAVKKMRGKANTKITLTLVREKTPKPITVTLTREIIHIDVVKSALYDRIGYLRIAQFNETTEKELLKGYNTLKQQAGGKLGGLVLDLRNDPGGLLDQAVEVSSSFIRSGEIVSTRARHAKDSQRWDAHGTDITDGLPMVVLINGGSASASEIVSGALQDHHRAVLIGTRTFGKGSVQSIIPIPGNGAVRLTTARYYTPSGRSIQALGITPDIVVKETREDPAFSLREADLEHILKNQGGNQTKAQPRTDLPAIAKIIPDQPPANWPEFEYNKPNTDFQLQEGLRVVRSMAGLPAPDPTASLPPVKPAAKTDCSAHN
ncbi:PDZ domain-containing protein [Acetobacter fabarum]|jgi:carboxyl-terminal processing protease|uniref:S41 family peptidase n=1 Tax=Acetobacter TaxID=434 RepID=UPI000A378360|nr:MULTISPECIES: S41 family peptidase [Acetobacter]MCH4026909.1 S41 family peptidase [Acetobacter fabarum]MCH4054959.1 S41 family peptidase [Acetobacter fabarum]MCH4085230.1 S41 family peptidase [Acetobacter fabarum]MCH4127225.1 S41 family peptidase [Acetobacter fabarum]MCH4137527.1 S41 family peptidase [Acetobacter fabarum]